MKREVLYIHYPSFPDIRVILFRDKPNVVYVNLDAPKTGLTVILPRE